MTEDSNLQSEQPDVPIDDVAPDANEPGDDQAPDDLDAVARDEPDRPDEVDQPDPNVEAVEKGQED